MSNIELIEMALAQADKELNEIELFKMNQINFEISGVRQLKDIQFDVNCSVENAGLRIGRARSWINAIKKVIEDDE